MEKINTLFSEQKYDKIVEQCNNNKFKYLKYLLLSSKLGIFEKSYDINSTIKIKLLCNWCSSEELMETWNKMSKGNYKWNNIELTCNNNPNYYVVINYTNEPHDKDKTFVFRMEPNMEKHPEIWGEWSVPKNYLKVFFHQEHYNNLEWHLGKTYCQLRSESPKKLYNILSTVLSAKYKDPGQIARIDFIKFLEKKGMEVHVYGDNKWNYKNYKGTLPYHKKDDALFPYKYTFNAENNSIPNYFTEKLVDGILAETLVFYSGPENITRYIDSKAFVQLTLSNFEKDYLTIKNAIENNLYEERIQYIREAKKKILEELQFFPRIEKEILQLKEKK